MLKIYNEAYSIAKKFNCTELVIHSNYKPGTDWYNGHFKCKIKYLEESINCLKDLGYIN